MKQLQSGYILVFTLIILGLLMGIATRMFYQTGAYLPLTDLMAKRERVKVLTLGGLNLAVSRLNSAFEKQDQLKQNSEIKSSDKSSDPKAKFLENILPTLNRWDRVTFEDENEGITGQIQFCITSEDGKINLNEWYHFEKKQFIETSSVKNVPKSSEQKSKTKEVVTNADEKSNQTELIFQALWDQLGALTKGQIPADQVKQGLARFLKNRTYPILDVTELLQIPEFAYFREHVFYEPPASDQPEDQIRPIYLTDLFTTYSQRPELQPWLLSDSFLAILGFSRAHPNDIIKRKEAVGSWLKNFSIKTDLKKDWKQTFGLMYGANLDLEKFGTVFASDFSMQAFGILVRATVGEVQQNLYAIVKTQNQQLQKDFGFVIEKLYWI